jgi:hypothetical protein
MRQRIEDALAGVAIFAILVMWLYLAHGAGY